MLISPNTNFITNLGMFGKKKGLFSTDAISFVNNLFVVGFGATALNVPVILFQIA